MKRADFSHDNETRDVTRVRIEVFSGGGTPPLKNLSGFCRAGNGEAHH